MKGTVFCVAAAIAAAFPSAAGAIDVWEYRSAPRYQYRPAPPSSWRPSAPRRDCRIVTTEVRDRSGRVTVRRVQTCRERW